MVRKKVRLERIADEKLRQATFNKRKNGLLKKAMELSVLCECDVAVIIFGTASNKLVQYSSMDMGNILERYSTACQQPHERRTNDELFKLYYTDKPYGEDEDEAGDADDDGKTEDRQKKRARSLEELTRKILRPGSPTLSDGSVSSLSEGSLLGAGVGDILKPLGLAIDRRVFPVSPKSERAFESITLEFDKLLEQMRQAQEQAGLGGGHQSNYGRENGPLKLVVPSTPHQLADTASPLRQQTIPSTSAAETGPSHGISAAQRIVPAVDFPSPSPIPTPISTATFASSFPLVTSSSSLAPASVAATVVASSLQATSTVASTMTADTPSSLQPAGRPELALAKAQPAGINKECSTQDGIMTDALQLDSSTQVHNCTPPVPSTEGNTCNGSTPDLYSTLTISVAMTPQGSAPVMSSNLPQSPLTGGSWAYGGAQATLGPITTPLLVGTNAVAGLECSGTAAIEDHMKLAQTP